ncbi:hypothetical protein [Burkholderia cenocepacia]|uniref:hypothetical protein n=1 Tax=Burkholderia cenocepacia TaxID=95486 RepID=UPI0021AB2940|nr:hypothetical protein [Burkholderia cenocepacia]
MADVEQRRKFRVTRHGRYRRAIEQRIVERDVLVVGPRGERALLAGGDFVSNGARERRQRLAELFEHGGGGGFEFGFDGFDFAHDD